MKSSKLRWRTRLLMAVTAVVLSVITAASARPERSISNTKYEASQALRDLVAQEFLAQYPPESRVSVYIDMSVRHYMLESISLTIDEQPRATRTYSKKQASALLQRGADRLFRFNAEPGKHRVQIEYNGYLARPNIKNLAISDALKLTIETKPGSQAFIMPIAPELLRPTRSLSAKDSREQWNWKTEADDPRLDLVRYLLDTDKKFEALIELLRVAGPSDESEAPPRGFHTLMAQIYLDLGMRKQAQRAILDARRQDDDPEALAGLWIGLANLDYARGQYSKAQQVLAYVPPNAQPAQSATIADLQARIFMAQGQFVQAAEVLANAMQTLEVNANKNRGSPELQLRYNYAVALIKSGNLEQGREILAGIGQANSDQPMLGDQANLALGYHLLNNALGSEARAVFQRLPLSSPYTNRGLLGLGWAELETEDDDGSRLQRVSSAWQPLFTRDPMDPAVQEALIVLPYAAEKSGQFDVALHLYQEAVNTFTRTQKQLRQRSPSLRSGRLRDAILDEDSAALLHTRAMAELYASHSFQAHIQNYRDLKRLQLALAQRDGSTQLQAQLGQLADQEIEIIENQLAQMAQDQLARLTQYIIDARLGLLRNYKRAQNSPLLRANPEAAPQ